jgi:hypothetical protein
MISSGVIDLLRRAEDAGVAGDWHAAMDLYRQVLKLNPGLVRSWIQYGNAAKELGDDRCADCAFQTALILGADPGLPSPVDGCDTVPESAPDPWRASPDGLMGAEAAAWAIRFFVGREPHDDAEIAFHRQHADLNSMRKAFSQTGQFKDFLATQQPIEPYRAPLFLLAPPSDPAVPWKLEPPTLEQPVSQLCTYGQMDSPKFRHWMEAIGHSPKMLHRKAWEFAYISEVLSRSRMLVPGKRALGFGVGREPLVSLFARYGVDIVATDAPSEVNQGFWGANQHSTIVEHLHKPDIVDGDTFRNRVTFRSVDMNHIPKDLVDFDFCWSACAFEHLGSIAQGLDFVENSLRCLKVGGLAVHTTEFNLTSNDATFESTALNIFRRQDIEALAVRLIRAGHEAFPLNFHPGDRELDTYIDAPPWAMPHLKIALASHTCTSIGLAVVKA